MNATISDILLSKLSEFVASQIGLNFPKERWHDLERGVISTAREFGFMDAESCIQSLLSSPLTRNQIEILVSHLTIGETYFFREKRSFEILELEIIPDLIRLRQGTEKRLRIWSAGCCTGEEPYSIAILLHKMMPDLRDWNINILATDINPLFLKKAQDGIYGEWSFRDTPIWVKERYFRKKRDDRLEILPAIKKMVNFSYLNLAEDVYPSLLNSTNAMDLIFCRNVLIYFTQERAKRVIQNIHHSLVDGGWLFVSPSEASQFLSSQFSTINFQGAILYRKDTGSEFKFPGSEFKIPTFEPEPETLNPKFETIEPMFGNVPLQPTGYIEDVKEKRWLEPEPTPYAEALGLYEQGSYAKAAEKIIEMISHEQADSKEITLLSRTYANQGRLTDALAWCEKAIGQDKLNPCLHYLRATILQEQGVIDEAIISLKRALYLNQDLILAHFSLGNLAMQQGRLKESERYLENALSLLSGYRQEEVLPESDGMTAGRMMEIIRLRITDYGIKK